MTLRRCVLIAAILLAPLFASAQTAPTADDRKHWADVTHKLEATPLDEDAISAARLAVAEIAVSHDFHVALCQDFYLTFNESQYVYHAQIRYLFMLGAATYQIETGKTDADGTNLYALRSVLKGYAAILKDNPKTTDKLLDDIAKQEARGKLPELIQKKGCNTAP
jgi:hypothetical protein